LMAPLLRKVPLAKTTVLDLVRVELLVMVPSNAARSALLLFPGRAGEVLSLSLQAFQPFSLPVLPLAGSPEFR